MKTLNKLILASTALLLLACGPEDESADSGKATDKAKAKCEEITKKIHGGKDGFKIKASRADERESVKLALDEKYESQTKYIASVSFVVAGKDEFCTCYINEDIEVINQEMLEE